jgi:hypothetical protein
MRVRVVSVGADSDPFTGQSYTSVSLAIESPIPRPPPHVANQYPPVPRPVIHKHIVHLFIPTTQWRGQYQMWQEYDLIVEDTGEMRLVLAHERVA